MGVRLRDLGEFGFLDRVRRWVGEGSAAVGIGDDAAIVRVGDSLLAVATDALVEGVHFRLDWSSPADVGWKAVAVNVSDLAAMGAEPRWALVALACPPKTPGDVLEGIYDGMREACDAYGVELVGGDTVRAEQIVLAVTALGELAGEPMRRSGATVGDVLAVTGPLGRAAAGANLLLAQKPEGLSPTDALACMEAHRRPRPRLAEALALARAGMHAAIDLSDGLAADARHIGEESRAGVEIDADKVPVAPEAAHVASVRGWDGLRMALTGGEDYELLVALPGARLEDVPVDLIEVGRIVEEGAWLVRDGGREELNVSGWDHFG